MQATHEAVCMRMLSFLMLSGLFWHYTFITSTRHLFIPRSHARHDFIVHEFYVLSPLKMLTIITIGSKHTQEIVFKC
jgi:hypothetical protein